MQAAAQRGWSTRWRGRRAWCSGSAASAACGTCSKPTTRKYTRRCVAELCDVCGAAGHWGFMSWCCNVRVWGVMGGGGCRHQRAWLYFSVRRAGLAASNTAGLSAPATCHLHTYKNTHARHSSYTRHTHPTHTARIFHRHTLMSAEPMRCRCAIMRTRSMRTRTGLTLPRQRSCSSRRWRRRRRSRTSSNASRHLYTSS